MNSKKEKRRHTFEFVLTGILLATDVFKELVPSRVPGTHVS